MNYSQISSLLDWTIAKVPICTMNHGFFPSLTGGPVSYHFFIPYFSHHLILPGYQEDFWTQIYSVFFLLCPTRPPPSTRNSKETLLSCFLFYPIYLANRRLVQWITPACGFLVLISPLGCAILSGMTAWLWLNVLAPTRKAMQQMPQPAWDGIPCTHLSGAAVYSPPSLMKQWHPSIAIDRKIPPLETSPLKAQL